VPKPARRGHQAIGRAVLAAMSVLDDQQLHRGILIQNVTPSLGTGRRGITEAPGVLLINSWRSPRVLRSSGCRDVSVAGSWVTVALLLIRELVLHARCGGTMAVTQRVRGGVDGVDAAVKLLVPRIWASPPVDCRAPNGSIVRCGQQR
jgi:hypothetical protein